MKSGYRKGDKKGRGKSQNKKGFEMAISTLVIIVLSIVVLIALILSFTIGWQKFWSIISGYFGNQVDDIQKTCQAQCSLKNENAFCCESKLLKGEKITCLDERVKTECDINCANVVC